MTLIALAKNGDYVSIEHTPWPADELNARDENGLTALMHAAGRGDCRTIAALKSAGADFEISDNKSM